MISQTSVQLFIEMTPKTLKQVFIYYTGQIEKPAGGIIAPGQ